MTSKFVCGAEIATIGNMVGGPVEGVQVAGVFNYAHQVKGAQLAAVVSVASGDVSGMQAGVVNVASGTVHGVQIGIVNYADDSDVSFGLINIMRKGRVGVDGFMSETGFYSLALKNGGKHWHSFYGVSYRGGNQDLRLGFLLGMGGHITLSRRWFADIDGFAVALGSDRASVPDPKGGWLAQVRGVVGLHPIPILSVYAGPTYNAYVTENLRSEPPMRSRFVATTETQSFSYSRWPGFAVGVQLMTGD